MISAVERKRAEPWHHLVRVATVRDSSAVTRLVTIELLDTEGMSLAMVIENLDKFGDATDTVVVPVDLEHEVNGVGRLGADECVVEVGVSGKGKRRDTVEG